MKTICILTLLISSFILQGQDSTSVTFSGKIIDSTTYQVLPGAEVYLVLEKDTLRGESDQNGYFLFDNLKPDKIYYVEIKKPNSFYLFNSFLFTYSLNAKKEIFIEYKIVPYARCHESHIPVILFEKNKFDLNSKNMDLLSGLLNILRQDKGLIINIYGYRSFNENKEVSYKRALAIKKYLVGKQIEPGRLFIVDKESKPRTIYPKCIYANIPIESQITVLSQEYINSLKSEKDKQEAIRNHRAVTFDIKSNDYKNK